MLNRLSAGNLYSPQRLRLQLADNPYNGQRNLKGKVSSYLKAGFTLQHHTSLACDGPPADQQT